MLRCKCTGSLRIVDATYDDTWMHERYECEMCGLTGAYSVDDFGDRTSGCVTITRDY
jgi:hypothetical protein